MHALKLNNDLSFHHHDDVYFCNDIAMDLSDSPLTAKLLQLFFTFPSEVITRDDILAYVYRIDLEKKYSTRLWEAHVHNAIKLVSRARLHAQRHWRHVQAERKICWFQFDNIGGGWRLYTVGRAQEPGDLGRSLFG